jgi:hypothetical protein
LLYYPHFTTTCFGLHRPSSGIAYTKCQKKTAVCNTNGSVTITY